MAMASFSQIVFKHLCSTMDSYGFKPSAATSSRGYAAFMARLESDICLYLLTKWDAINVQCYARFWVAPTAFPDDSLERLGVGLSSLLATASEPNQEFAGQVMDGLAKEMSNVTEKIASVRRACTSARANPSKAFSVLLYMGRLVLELKEYSKSELGSYCQHLFQEAGDVAVGKFKWNRFERDCQTIAKQLLEDCNAPAIVRDPILERDADALGFCLARHCYIEAFVPWPPDKCS